MKKTISIFALLIIIAVCFSACSSNNVASGTYYYQSNNKSAALILNDDNTFTFVESYSKSISYSGTYSVKDNVLTLTTTDKSSSAKYIFNIAKDKLIFSMSNSTPLFDSKNISDKGEFVLSEN